MLTTLNLKTIKQMLEEQRANLLVFVKKKQTSMHAKSVTNPDNTDRAMISRNRRRDMLLLDHVKGQLDDIDHALKRLETGTYGICIDCGEQIQPARLEIMPAIALCVECQRIRENKLRS